MKKTVYGFTLIEMILYISLLTVLMTVLTSLFISILDNQLKTSETSEVEQDGRFIIARFIYDISQAQNITLPATVGGTSSSLQFTQSGINYTYSPSNGNLQLSDGTYTDMLNSYNTSISNLTFQRLGNASGKNTISVHLMVTSKIQSPGGGFEQKDFTITVGTR